MVIMVMRTIPPLEDREWKALVSDLEKGPSDEQAEYVREAIKLADTFKVSYDD